MRPGVPSLDRHLELASKALFAALLVAAVGGCAGPTAPTPVAATAGATTSTAGLAPSLAASPSMAATSTAAPSQQVAPTPGKSTLPSAFPARASGGPGSLALTVIPVRQPSELAVLGPAVWAIAGSGLARIDIATNQVTPFDVGAGSDSLDNLAATPAAIWVADFDGSEVRKVDPASGAAVDTIAVGAAEDVLPVGGAVWVTNHHEGSVTRIDAASGRVLGTVTVGQAGTGGPQQLAEGAGSVWTDESNNSTLVRMDPASGKVQARISMPPDFGDCGGILATGTAVWVTGCHDSMDVVRIDPRTNKIVADVTLDGYAQDPVEIGGKVWVAAAGFALTRELERIDPATNRVDRKVRVDALADDAGSAIAGGDYWVSNGTDAVLRIPLSELTAP